MTFPCVPGLATPGRASPGAPAGATAPTGAYLIGVQSGPAGSATTVITAVNGTAAHTGTVVALSSASATPTGVADAAGNTYTLAAGDAAGNEPTWVYVALDTAALTVGQHITVTWSGTAGAKNAIAVTAPGVRTASAVDRTATGDGTSTAPAATTAALSQGSELAIAVISSAFAGGTVGWGTGWMAQASAQNGTSPFTSAAVMPVTAAAAVTASGTLPASAAWTTVVVTLELPASGPSIVQAVPGGSVMQYGIDSAEMTSTGGNTLLVMAAWNLAPDSLGPMPALYVSDSAGNGNVWHHLATSSPSGRGSRCAAWACTNALAVEWVSVGLTSFASSLAWTVLEIAGMPAFTDGDVSVTGFTRSGTTLALSGTNTSADIAFACLGIGEWGISVSSPPMGWTALPPVSAGAGTSGNPPVAFPNWLTLFPYWLPSSPAGAVSASWTASGGGPPLSGLLVTISASPPTPALTTPGFPNLKVEAGFGATPGDPTQPPPAYTDITARTLSAEGDFWVDATYGRQYELSQPEAGKMTIGLRNNDGAFTPGNTASPYYPDVAVGTPIRVTAYWVPAGMTTGRWYHVAYGWVERWPQEWPDMPQWGLSKMVATDAVAVMSSATMPSALQGDILLDAPYAFLPGDEQYFTATTGFTEAGNSGSGILASVTPAEAQGLPAVNAARANQKAGVYVDGASGVSLDTGQTLNLLGDNGTGFGTSSATATLTRGPGMIYSDPAMPSPAGPTGVSVEMWLVKPDKTETTVLVFYPPPSPYCLGSFEIRVNVAGTLGILLPQTGLWHTVPFTPSPGAQQIVVTCTATAQLSVYANGLGVGSWVLPAANVTPWYALSAGCARYAWGAGSGGPFTGDYTAADVVIYPYPLPPSRVWSHWDTGLNGTSGDTFTQRMAKILGWGYLGLPRGGPVTFGGSAGDVFQGPAYDLSGSSAAEGANVAALGDGGYYAAMPSGILTVIPRWWTYNRAPGVTFGDAVTPGTEIPYLPGQAFDYDNTYLYDNTQTTRTDGPNQGITAVTRDPASQDRYFPRPAYQVQVETTSDYDAYDNSAWALARYSQPSLRVRAMVVDAASNPTAFPAVLSTRAGDIATVVRRPVGGAVIGQDVQVQRVGLKIGPSRWEGSYQLSPYTVPGGQALMLDTAGQDTIGASADPR